MSLPCDSRGTACPRCGETTNVRAGIKDCPKCGKLPAGYSGYGHGYGQGYGQGYGFSYNQRGYSQGYGQGYGFSYNQSGYSQGYGLSYDDDIWAPRYEVTNQAGELPPKDIILKDITNSAKWPVSEKLCKVLFISPLPSHLECEICLDVLSEPLQTSCCGQSYCKECISKLKKKVCPHCRENLEVFPDKKSIRFINELKIKCPYHIENKCHWEGISSELKNHLKSCDIKPVFCSLGCGMQFEKKNEKIHIKHLCSWRKIPCKYCQKQIMEKDMTKHHEVCPKMLLPCANKCSSKEITRENMKQHILVCPEQVVTCKYQEFGCAQVIKRKDHDQHLSSTIEQHLYLVAECARKERDARKVLEKKIEENTAARKSLEKRIAQLEDYIY